VEVEAEPEAASVGTSSEMRSLSGDVQAAAPIVRQSLQIAGVGVTPEIAAIFLVYFVQGILGLSRLAKEFFVKDELGLDPAAASLVFTVSSIPWLVKPLWGFISDAVPLFGYRRKSYLALCGVLGTVGGVALATVVKDVPGAAVAFTAGSLSTAFADVVIDGVVVARARVSAEKNRAGRVTVSVLGISRVRRYSQRVLQWVAHRNARHEVRVRNNRVVPSAHRVRRGARPGRPARFGSRRNRRRRC
jgi:hypothetical protein